MKIAVCLIVFNGKPYIDYWLKHYTECPDIDYVCIAEGATANMARVLNLPNAGSNDGTIESIYRYYQHPKVRFVTATIPYPEKMEQQNAYVDLLPDDTDYIWIADSDEFYHYSDIKLMRGLLEQHGYTFVEFIAHHFWKDMNTVGVGGHGWAYDQPMDRIFKYYPGARFLFHRPIKMLDRNGIPVKEIKPLKGALNPVRMFHYSYVTQKNVYEKMMYYTLTMNRNYMIDWYYPVWEKWTHENRYEIESRYSIHPSCPGATTKYVNLIHPINIYQ
jgi:hypothetical protein